MGQTVWHPATETPAQWRRFVALFDDGSGAFLAISTGEGFVSGDGDEFDSLKGVSLWAYVPESETLWCENCAEDPFTFPAPTSEEGGR